MNSLNALLLVLYWQYCHYLYIIYIIIGLHVKICNIVFVEKITIIYYFIVIIKIKFSKTYNECFVFIHADI